MSKKDRKELPDLAPIGYALTEARALVKVAYQVILQGDDPHGESAVLRFAVKALDSVHDQLDKADGQLRRYREAEKPKK